MKILLNGCSFSSGYGVSSSAEVDDKDCSYPSFLEQYGHTIDNISAAGKDNFQMYRELYSIIINNNSDYDTIIWQLTDYPRELEFRNSSSGYIRFGDIYSQTIDNTQTLRQVFFKKIQHSLLDKNIKNNNYTGNGYPRTSSKIVYTDPHDRDKMVETVELGNTDIGDTSLNYNLINLAIYIHSLANLCRSKDIRLVLYNYYGFPGKCFNDALYSNLDQKIFAIKNITNGMYYQLWRMGFERPIDGFHWGIEAHKYQAKILNRFLRTNERFVVVEEHKSPPLYDYT